MRAHEFETIEEAIGTAREMALLLGNSDFPPGASVVLMDENGDLVIEIPLDRLHS